MRSESAADRLVPAATRHAPSPPCRAQMIPLYYDKLGTGEFDDLLNMVDDMSVSGRSEGSDPRRSEADPLGPIV